MNDTAMKSRINSRREAEAAWDLLIDARDAASDPAAYWNRIRELVLVNPDLLPPSPEPPEPMSDADARVFGQADMPFGKYANFPIKSIDLQYLCWLVEQEDAPIKAQIRRYLKSPMVARWIKDEEDSDDQEDEENYY